MIRINLLPRKRDRATEGGQAWLLVVMGVLLVQIVALIFFHQIKRNELDEITRQNGVLTGQIDAVKREVANHAAVKAQLEVLRAREGAIERLQAARTGPTAVLLELTKVLTSGRGPTVDPDRLEQLRRDNPAAMFNPGWDTRRLWIGTYEETDRLVKIKGLARDGDDVSELARRLNLSNFFGDVKLLPATKEQDQLTKQELIKFELEAKARY